MRKNCRGWMSTSQLVAILQACSLSGFAILNASQSAYASPVVYTLQTVADGSIGGHSFKQALVTIQMIGDTRLVTSQPSQVDATKPVYENRVGSATVTIDDGGEVISAIFQLGEVYVRYDTGTGVAGFGSAISPTYPIALNCSNYEYPPGNYKVDCLQGEAWNYGSDVFDLYQSGILAQLSIPNDPDPSPGVSALAQSLSQDTLLTGMAHACAGIYSIATGRWEDGDLWTCDVHPSPSQGLRTSKGELFFWDSVGGSHVPTVVGDQGGWYLANTGSLHVEVYERDN